MVGRLDCCAPGGAAGGSPAAYVHFADSPGMHCPEVFFESFDPTRAADPSPAARQRRLELLTRGHRHHQVLERNSAECCIPLQELLNDGWRIDREWRGGGVMMAGAQPPLLVMSREARPHPHQPFQDHLRFADAVAAAECH